MKLAGLPFVTLSPSASSGQALPKGTQMDTDENPEKGAGRKGGRAMILFSRRVWTTNRWHHYSSFRKDGGYFSEAVSGRLYGFSLPCSGFANPRQFALQTERRRRGIPGLHTTQLEVDFDKNL